MNVKNENVDEINRKEKKTTTNSRSFFFFSGLKYCSDNAMPFAVDC